ncbi:MAG: hypothetical protein WD077_11635 [Bacteroidia bacterium]
MIMLRFALFILLSCIAFSGYSQPYLSDYTDAGNIGLSISNTGTIGRPNVRNDPSGPPSMEYPLGSGIEHLFEGGIWIGAQFNGNTTVSTAAFDAPSGYTTGASGFEFTTLSGIVERSSLPGSENFSSAAISHQDFVTNFTDSNVIVPGTNIPVQDHNLPLMAVVNLESYAWNFSFADFFVILNYSLTNHSNSSWDSVYLGMWSDLVVRNVNVTQESGSAFFNKGGGGFSDSASAIYAYQVSGDDFDYTRSYGASQILGVTWRDQYFHPENDTTFTTQGLSAPRINGNFWNFRSFDGSLFGAPEDDLERYTKMKNGMDFTDQSTQSTLKAATNKIQLISIGAIPEIAPGETVQFTMAMVAARQLDDPSSPELDTRVARQELMEHLNWSKRTYLGEDLNANGELDANEDLNSNNSLDRFILPEPPASPKVKIQPRDNAVDIYWTNNSVSSIDPISKKQDFEGFKLYRTKPGDDLQGTGSNEPILIAQWDSAGNNVGFNNGFEDISLRHPVPIDSLHYHFRYTINDMLNGWQYRFILTAFDEGDENLGLEPLESSFTENTFRVFPGTPPAGENENVEIGVYPNPYRTSAAWDGTSSRTRKIYFYNLPERCVINIYTLAGDVVAKLEHDASSYNGEDIRWFQDFSGSGSRVFSGGEHAWDLLSESGQQVTQGVYLFAVEDLGSSEIKHGSFAILK